MDSAHTPPSVSDREGAKELPPVRGRVEFDHVWLRYDSTPENEWVLKDIGLSRVDVMREYDKPFWQE